MHRILFVLLCGLIITTMPTTSFAQSEQAPITGAASVYCPQLSQTMVRGARDRATVTPGQVTELQKFISDYYDIDPYDIITGYFGPLTHWHVVRFQQEQGLPAFGIVGPLTRAAIARVCGESPAPAAQSCQFNGQTIADGASITAYAAATASPGAQCVSETRTCVKGVLTGSYGYATCNVGSNFTEPPISLLPILSFSGKDAKVAPGQQTTLTWSATNASWCSAGGGWSGTKATSGTETTAALWQTTTFTLTCFGPGGLTPVTKSVTVSVIPEEPAQPTFSALPTSGFAPLSVTFTIGNLTNETTRLFTIFYGDGTSGTIDGTGCTTNSPGCGSMIQNSHTYTANGMYTATLLSRSCYFGFQGCSDTTLGTVTIAVNSATY